jgi:hypothetical protein
LKVGLPAAAPAAFGTQRSAVLEVEPDRFFTSSGRRFLNIVNNDIDRQTLSLLALFLKQDCRRTNTDDGNLPIGFRLECSIG